MPRFSRRSEGRLLTCDPRLQNLFEAVVERFDCAVICGRRDREDQEEAFRTGHSKARYGKSPHNAEPLSLAVDVAPWPIDWNDRDRFLYFGGYVLGVADLLAIPVRWGGDWDGDHQLSDQTFDDLVHFEIDGWRDEQ